MATNATKKTIQSFMMALLESDDGVSWEDLLDEVLEARFETLKLSISNYNNVVQQNKSLQTQLNETTAALEKLKEKPFFPYLMNSGNMADFGEFYLVSHAWFSFLDEKQQIGIVEVEYKNQNGRRVMYMGITKGEPTQEGFVQSVLKIANYGQKIKDSSDGV